MDDVTKGIIFIIGMAPVAWRYLVKSGEGDLTFDKWDGIGVAWAVLLVVGVNL
jgi:hypothetical protein